MLNKLRAKLEAQRNTTNPFLKVLLFFKYGLAKIFKGKETQYKKDHKSQQLYDQFISKNDLVFDIGANLGEKTKIFLKCGARVIAVEPQKACLKKLNERYKSNKNVKIEPFGLSSEKSSATIYTSTLSNAVSTFSKKWQKGRFENEINWDGEELVEMITLEDLIQQHGVPKFCKIDVEGFELEVIKGLKSKIPVISFEFSEEFVDETIEIIEILSKLGFTEFNLLEEEQTFLDSTKWHNDESFKTLLTKQADKERKQLWGDIYAK